MWMLLFACGVPELDPDLAADRPTEPDEPDEPEPEPEPEPEDPMPVQEFKLPVGHCTANERMRFNCNVGSGKSVSICEGTDGWSYRFGKLKQIELQVPESGFTQSFEVSRRTLGEDEEVHIASLWNAGHRYAIESHRTEDQFEGSLTVRKGATSIAALPCKGQPSVDFTEITGRFAGDPADPHSWVGTWSAESGEAELRIGPPEPDPDAKPPEEPPNPDDFSTLEVHGTATWHGGGGVVHTGEADGQLVKKETGWALEGEGCNLTLRRMVADTMFVEDNSQCGGMNVRFDGTYFRLP